MNSAYSSNSLFSLGKKTFSTFFPDEPSSTEIPSKDFVLCRDLNNNPTAIYGDNTWDFNPYRLSSKKIRVFHFDNILSEDNEETRLLIQDAKWLIYCLIYHAGAGKIGRIGASTIASYYGEITKAVRYCYSLKNNKLIGFLRFKDLFSNVMYLSAFINTNRGKSTFNKRINSLLTHLTQIGDELIGYRICSRSGLDFVSVAGKQHPIIPTNVYLNLINYWSDWLDVFFDHRDDLCNLLRCFKDEHYGLAKTTQKSIGVGGVKHQRPDIAEAIIHHGLDGAFTGVLSVTNRASFAKAISSIQYICKNVIHLYTGMRDQEVNRMFVGCLTDEVISPDIYGLEGDLIDVGRVVSVISTTTKFTGYRQEVSWIASGESIRAIRLAESIAVGIASLFNDDDFASGIPLFISPALITGLKDKTICVNNFDRKTIKAIKPSIKLTEADIIELKASDVDRDFDSELKFSVGRDWPLTSHQYRRSLAFYASSSGFVSLPSLKKQFKHLTLQMSQYYQRGFQNLITVFGAYDEKSGEYDLPNSHIAFEFQTGITIETAHMILSDVLDSEARLFGGVGSYIEKQRSAVSGNEVDIKNLRSDTEKRVAKGELAYRKTLLGGCTKVEKCDEYLQAEVTACIGCASSVLDENKLSEQIKSTEVDMSAFDHGSVEYSILKFELDQMKSYQSRKVNSTGAA